MPRQTRKVKRTLDVRSQKEISKLNSLMEQAPFTLVLIYADWCPHCHDYLPMWDQFANLPGRNANMAKVHFDMQEKIPNIANAKINGYPSVIKVLPNGTIEEFKSDSGETTNAVPNMRDTDEMMKNLITNKSNKFRRNWNAAANAPAEESVEKAAAVAAEESAEKAAEKAAEEASMNTAEKTEKAAEKVAELKEVVKEAAKQNNKKIKNVNVHPGILTAEDIMETTRNLAKQQGGRRKKIESFLSGGSLIEDLRTIGSAYFKK